MDYPRDYVITNLHIECDTVFLLMPIQRNYDSVMKAIVESCDELGICCKRDDKIRKQNTILFNILDGIAKSELIIADISDNNPNVLYELGIAHTLKPRHSVILISQNIDPNNIPFDIRHWPIIFYKTDELLVLKQELKLKIQACRNEVDSSDYIYQLLLNYKFSPSVISEFIASSHNINKDYLTGVCSVIGPRKRSIHLDQIKGIYKHLIILGELKAGIFRDICILITYLFFASDSILSCYPELIKDLFLTDSEREGILIIDTDRWELVSKICYRIIIGKFGIKKIAIEWLIGYLHNTRMGRIDRVRTQIEDFLLTTKDDDIDDALINLLVCSSRTAKESAIDICGQKPIYKAIDYLIMIIQDKESDAHLVRSSINALARMKVTSAAPIILNWMRNNRDKWGPVAVSSSLKNVAEKALLELDENYYQQMLSL